RATHPTGLATLELALRRLESSASQPRNTSRSVLQPIGAGRMTTRLVFRRSVWDQLGQHFKTASPSEDGAFLLVNNGHGTISDRLVVRDLLLPPEDAWDSRGNHNLRPSGRWVSAAIGTAIESGSGLAFVHSHPDTHHPSELSMIDKATSKEWARTFVPTLSAPFA